MKPDEIATPAAAARLLQEMKNASGLTLDGIVEAARAADPKASPARASVQRALGKGVLPARIELFNSLVRALGAEPDSPGWRDMWVRVRANRESEEAGADRDDSAPAFGVTVRGNYLKVSSPRGDFALPLDMAGRFGSPSDWPPYVPEDDVEEYLSYFLGLGPLPYREVYWRGERIRVEASGIRVEDLEDHVRDGVGRTLGRDDSDVPGRAGSEARLWWPWLNRDSAVLSHQSTRRYLTLVDAHGGMPGYATDLGGKESILSLDRSPLALLPAGLGRSALLLTLRAVEDGLPAAHRPDPDSRSLSIVEAAESMGCTPWLVARAILLGIAGTVKTTRRRPIVDDDSEKIHYAETEETAKIRTLYVGDTIDRASLDVVRRLAVNALMTNVAADRTGVEKVDLSPAPLVAAAWTDR